MKRSPIKKRPTNPRKKLIRELDKAFSLFIRNRGSVNGKNTCFTCGKILPIERLHCGHFMVRQRAATRWSEINCQPQCPSCNTFFQGRQAEFGLALDEKYGEGTGRQLIDKSYTFKKYDIGELEDLIAHYRKIPEERRL